MDDLIEWLRDRPYYEGQIRDHRRVPSRDPEFADVALESRLQSALSDRGIDRLYRHQAEAIDAVRDGENVVLATQTASGKSLAYTVPAFERAMDHGGRTLYLGPQNALIADQDETLSDLAFDLGFGSRVSVEQYTGRLSKTEKRDVRDRRPTVLLSNPDMLHYALLPHAHRLWEWFFSSLETVVIDEIHGYRGVFGSHVALTLRRLNRICERFDSDPQYVCCSATIGNPVEHAARVTGMEQASFRLVDEDTSGTGATHWVLWNPPEYRKSGRGGESGRRRSSHVETKNLFVDLLSRGHQTLAFTRARQAAERYATESVEDLRERGKSEAAAGVSAYQAALKHEKRREIESGLHDGNVTGVWSTNALELGVDVGGLDAVLIDGYPGTRMSAFQQAGRAGRGDDDALVILVGGEDQLDQYLLHHPEEFWDGEPERAICNPTNEELLPDHVASAAAENWLKPDDHRHFGETTPDVVSALETAGRLDRRETNNGIRWTHSGGGSPQHEMSLRSIESREVDLLDGRSNEVIASLSFGDALRDAHPGAIYHHQGQSYEVTELDLDRDTAILQPTWADYYTRVLHDKTITVEEDLRSKSLSARPDTEVRFADVTMRKQITGFERRDPKRGEAIGRESLNLPETTLRTKALYVTVPRDVEAQMRAMGDETREDGAGQYDLSGGDYGFAGGIHAAEHGMISLFPLSFLCDRGDIGGLSTPHHTHTDQSTIFVYDGYPGGVGLTENGYDEVETLLRRTHELIRDCDCEDGCPACVQSPQCGNANDPLSKAEAVHLLAALSGEGESSRKLTP
ncbi:DEAD/DEAH box helicase [Halogeometricum borinquense]|uniref:DEAD/DEAH box helicase n=1 Tax=Halogeometricum borinquense TaxID=60847 RepID=A0A6C0UHG7_9EURY|nr:DEAD/DEAH box helicase [Halogeometricum borinquense]QIB74670.1 DEAD/DEAH box helicase [Halogeometricum borinquense]QIQ76377.1 DEAD/DEAH box helicase [Halogeometricum borinquense]